VWPVLTWVILRVFFLLLFNAPCLDFPSVHNEQVWNAMLHVKCPIPQVIHEHIRHHLPSDSSSPPPPSFYYMDLVPVRTPPRETLTGCSLPLIKLGHPAGFDPVTEWGDGHVLPPVSHSGRWANIPICPSSIPVMTSKKLVDVASRSNNNNNNKKDHNTDFDSQQGGATNKPNYLVGCIWASAVFSERGKTAWDTHTSERLLEWLTYHLNIAGFDHMVVYDNTEAFTNETSLESVTSLFPGQVTRQPWKHRVCNNNGYGSRNAGERSSQYAAEASCRTRYGPTTEWMAFFDTDEYFIPSGNWSSVREMLQAGVADGRIDSATHILSFYETKAMLNYRFTEHYTDDSSSDCPSTCTKCDCRKKRDDATFLEAFCEPLPFPRKYPEAKTKMKQIYRPSFVLNHFVHYAAVTDLVNTRPKFPRVVGYPIERRAKEFTEGYMLHTKTRLPHLSRNWNSTSTCRQTPDKCSIGIPYPYYQGSADAINGTFANNLPVDSNGHRLNEFGIPFNCYELRKVQEDLAIRLHHYLDPLKKKWQNAVAATIQAPSRRR
jgi:Glycosyltransferase family 92